MKMPKEFEDVFEGVELTEDEIRTLTWIGEWESRTVENLRSAIQKAQATALSTLQAENEKLRAELKTCKEKNAGLALALLTECAPNPDCLGDDEWRAIRVELERVKAERDAAVEDVAAIIGDVEEIRRGYDVGNADADGAFAVLCETYCTNKGRSCYAECEKYHCKNFKWRGRKED